jgi:hypothetical protein
MPSVGREKKKIHVYHFFSGSVKKHTTGGPYPTRQRSDEVVRRTTFFLALG